ncbi:MAG: FHA domain-containing serine/threonine-protein kinase [Planctomycetota bacterium]|nr:FHA domain-containing serine/threonine-protein kinase [Planctomycetota bacterium]
MDLVFDLTEGPDIGRRLRFVGHGTYVLGRAGDPDADLQLPTDARMSRRHAEVDFGPEGCHIRLLTGTGSLEIDGQRVEAAPLRSGSVLRMGATSMTVRFTEASPAVRENALPRRRLEAFELEDELGRGAMGCVYAARDRATGEAVAIKRFEPDLSWAGEDADLRTSANERAVGYFLREMELSAVLEHPHIVRTLGIGREKEELFLVMERIEGCTLMERVRIHGVLDMPLLLKVARALLDALTYAHAKGIIHRDVCPSNLLLAEDPEGRITPKLGDFGIGKSMAAGVSAALTRTGEARGKEHFMAPECLRDAKRATEAVDVFSAGATLYYALTGKPWFGDNRKHRWADLARGTGLLAPLREVNPDVPEAIAAVIEKALAPRIEDRYTSAREVRDALDAAAAALAGADDK